MSSDSAMRQPALTLAGLSTILLACGGGGYQPPSPLSHTFPEEKLARIEMENRTQVAEERNNYLIAKDAHSTAVSRHQEASTELHVAKNELKQAVLDLESAQVRKKDADASGDLTQINKRKSELREAQLRRKTASLKVDALKAQRTYLKYKMRHKHHARFAQEARYQLAMARVAKDHNIRPPGFKYGVYEQQVRERSRASEKSKAVAEDKRKAADKAKAKWLKAKQVATSESAG